MIKIFTPKLAEIGKIKIGGKSSKVYQKKHGPGTFRPPVKFGYIVITKNTKDQYDNWIIDQEAMKTIGEDKPKSIKIVLLYDDIDLNLLSSFALYKGKKCICRGDGEKAEREFKPGEKNTVNCAKHGCEYLENGNCKPSCILSVILPYANKIGGVYKYRSHSWNTVQNLQSSLYYLKSKTGGKLAGIPLKLEMIKKHTNDHGEVDVMNIVFNGDENKLHQAVIEETKKREKFKIDVKQIENEAKKLGLTNDNDDPGDVEEEFYNNQPQGAAEKAQTIDADAFVTSAPENGLQSNIEQPKNNINNDDIDSIL